MDRRYVGIDLHRRRSGIYAMDGEGDKLFCERIASDPVRLLKVVSASGQDAEARRGVRAVSPTGSCRRALSDCET